MVSEDSAYIKTLAETLHGLRNESNVGMWLAVCELAAADNVPSIISTVLTVLESQDKVLVERAIEVELRNTNYIQEVFRHESWLFSIFKEYLRHDTLSFMRRLLKPVVKNILKLKSFQPGSRLQHLQAFAAHFQDEALHMPPRFAFAFSVIRKESILRYGDDSPVAAMVYFLRFVCPMIINPKKTGVTSGSLKSEQCQNLIAFSKLLLEVVKMKYDTALTLATMGEENRSEKVVKENRDTVRGISIQIHRSFNDALDNIRGGQVTCLAQAQKQDMTVQRGVANIANWLVTVDWNSFRRSLRRNRAPQSSISELCSFCKSAMLTYSDDQLSLSSLPEGLDCSQPVLPGNKAPRIDSSPTKWTSRKLRDWLLNHDIPESVANKCIISGQDFLKLRQEDLLRFGIVALGHQKKLLRLQHFLKTSSAEEGQALNGSSHVVNGSSHVMNGSSHVVNGSSHVLNGSSHAHLRPSSFTCIPQCSEEEKRNSVSDVLNYKDVSLWTAQEVVSWFESQHLAAYEEDILSQHFDGKRLLSVTEKDLDALSIYALGHRKKILSLVKQLRCEPRLGGVYKWSVEEVVNWLESVKLGAYSTLFKQKNINGWNLMCLQDSDLQEMGINIMGHRKQILRNRRSLLTNRSEIFHSLTL